MRIILSDPAKSGTEDGAWIEGYDYQNKDKIHYHFEKLESVIFFGAVYHSKTHVISHPVIAAIFDGIFDVIFSILQR